MAVKKKGRRRNVPGRYDWKQWANAGAGIAQSALQAYQSSSSRTMTQSKKRSNPPPITGESDWRRVYTRRRMPARRRRRWVRFSKKVQHVIGKSVAPKFNVFTRGETFTSLGNKQVVIANHTVLGGNGASPHTNDITDLVRIAQGTMPLETTDPSTTLSPWRIKVTGWMIESSITNNSVHTIYIDMYYWRTKRDVPAAIESVSNLWEESVADLARNSGLSTNAIATIDYGITPFQGVQFAKNVNIYRKQRIKLAPGGTTQVEQRSGRNYLFDYGFVEHYSMVRRATEGILMVAYGSPDPAFVLARDVNITMSTNVNYTWRVLLSGRVAGAEQDNP